MDVCSLKWDGYLQALTGEDHHTVLKTASEMQVAPRIFSSTVIYFQPLLSTFV